jgi:hypothetical protein
VDEWANWRFDKEPLPTTIYFIGFTSIATPVDEPGEIECTSDVCQIRVVPYQDERALCRLADCSGNWLLRNRVLHRIQNALQQWPRLYAGEVGCASLQISALCVWLDQLPIIGAE